MLGVGAALFAVGALTGYAFTSGWGAANRAGNATLLHTQVEEVLISVPEFGGLEGAAVMPDVRGLSQDEAMQVLVDAGVPEQIVTTAERSAAGEPGTVIQQSPVFGSPNPATVLLVISTEATVPEVVGRSAQSGVDALQGMGARVIQEKVFVPGATVGFITETIPAAGTRLPETITFRIADTPVERVLAEVSTVVGYVSNYSDVVVDGVTYASGFQVGAGSEPTQIAWNLNNAATLLRGKLGLDPDQTEEQSARIEFFADGELIHTQDITTATPTDFEIDVSGVGTLMLVVTNTREESYSVRAAFYDATLVGSYTQMGLLP
ncbi:MAG: PASTA domain-containing protein [Bifidobacteriaceae bacterium]|nr:PASTA domain-containing protein [Bifidobacteriaceae bacterium]